MQIQLMVDHEHVKLETVYVVIETNNTKKGKESLASVAWIMAAKHLKTIG